MGRISATQEMAVTRDEYFELNAGYAPVPSIDGHVNPESDNMPVLAVVREQWQQKAMCRNTPGLMYDREAGEILQDYENRVRLAKKFCGQCAVQSECLDYAISNGEKFHIWGGLTPTERKAWVRKRKAS